MPLNARERALALISVLEPTDLVPCRLLAELLEEVQDGPSPIERPPHPDGWTTKSLAAYYACGLSTMRGRIEAGEFGLPESEGGPRKAGRRGWLVPHHQVLARDARVQGEPWGASTPPTAGPSATSPTRAASSPSQARVRRLASRPSSTEARRAVGMPSLTDARRQRRSGPAV